MTNILFLTIGLPALIAFIVLYTRNYPWRKSFQGQALVAQKCAWVVLFVHLLLAMIFDYPGRHIVGTIVVGVVVGMMWVTLWGLVDSLEKARANSPGVEKPKMHENTLPRAMRKPRK